MWATVGVLVGVLVAAVVWVCYFAFIWSLIAALVGGLGFWLDRATDPPTVQGRAARTRPAPAGRSEC